MATHKDTNFVEAIIGYSFRSREHLVQALTAAGAIEQNHDGNRKFAHLGSNVLRFILSFVAFETVPSRSKVATIDIEALTDGLIGQITNLETFMISNTQRASVAEKTHIDKCIKYSMKPGSRSPRVLALAINAIVGAVYIDSTDFNATWKVALKLGLFSADLAGSSSSPTLSAPDMPDSSLLLSNQSAAVEGMEISLDQVYNANTQSHAETLLSNGFIDESLIAAQASGHGLFTPVDVLSGIEIPTTQESPFWTPLWRNLNENQVSPQEINCFVGGDESPCFDLEMIYSQDSLPSVARYDEDMLVIPSGQKSNRVWNEYEKRINSPPYQARLLDDRLKSFLDEEDKKCQSHQYPLPFQTFFAPPIQDALMGMGADANMFARLLVYIASAEALVTLRQIVVRYRGSPSLISLGPRPDLSKKERYDLIGVLGGEIVWCRLLRMHHVLDLYETCGGTGYTGTLIVTTPASFQSRKRRAGNPLHAAEAQITERMMEDIFPDLLPCDDGYKEKKASLKRIRKFGQRLYILAVNFGRGVLGLMLNDDMKSLGISEQM